MTKYKANYFRLFKEYLRGFRRDPAQFFVAKKMRICPCCGFQGYFVSMRKNRRDDYREARCPNCASRERDRLFSIIVRDRHVVWEGKKILHFSPESHLFRRLIKYKGYISGDIKPNKYAKYHVDITDVPYPDNYFDYVICHHVIEHVQEDMKALQECARVLKKNGLALISVPIDQTLDNTFEPPDDMPNKEVERICGWDHKRLYAEDFIEKIQDTGLRVERFVIEGEDKELYRTGDGPIFIAIK